MPALGYILCLNIRTNLGSASTLHESASVSPTTEYLTHIADADLPSKLQKPRRTWLSHTATEHGALSDVYRGEQEAGTVVPMITVLTVMAPPGTCNYGGQGTLALGGR